MKGPLLAAALLGLCVAASAQDSTSGEDGGGAAQDLAKQLSNPTADLVSVPMQFNWEQGVGYQDATRTILNIQPVVPFTLNDDWNLIARWIMPFVSQPSLAPGIESTFGLSDVVFSTFFSPRNSESGFTWGVGPVLALPMTDEPTLGSGKWQAGPTVVLLKQQGPWTYGLLANYLASFADSSDEDRADVRRSFLQPFLAYSTPTGITYAINSETTYDHEAANGDQWTVPINIAVSKITQFGPFPFSIQVGYGYFADAPSIGPERKLRAAFTLILPRNR
jgi:hypothetical protein